MEMPLTRKLMHGSKSSLDPICSTRALDESPGKYVEYAKSTSFDYWIMGPDYFMR